MKDETGKIFRTVSKPLCLLSCLSDSRLQRTLRSVVFPSSPFIFLFWSWKKITNLTIAVGHVLHYLLCCVCTAPLPSSNRGSFWLSLSQRLCNGVFDILTITLIVTLLHTLQGINILKERNFILGGVFECSYIGIRGRRKSTALRSGTA